MMIGDLSDCQLQSHSRGTHTYLPCRLDTEDSIHHLQKEASAVLHPAAIPICPPIGVIFAPSRRRGAQYGNPSK